MTHFFSQLKLFLFRKDRFFAQFIKYVFCGGVSVLVDQLSFYLLAWRLLPCLRATDPAVRLMEWAGVAVHVAGEEELARHYWIIKGICFLISNAVVYALNVLFVFRTGRHRKPVEVLLFFGSSLFQFFFIWLGGILITEFYWEVTCSNVTMLVTSMMLNYLIRKKFVFNG